MASGGRQRFAVSPSALGQQRTCTALLKAVMPRLFLTCRDMIKVAHTEAAGSLDHGLLPQLYRAS